MKSQARLVFDPWFDIIAKGPEKENKELMFEYFYSGFIAGTRFNPEPPSNTRTVNIQQDDIGRNLDL